MIRVSAPASSANLGPAFDSVGMALDLRLTVTVGGGPPAGERHPAVVAFRRRGGTGPVAVQSVIPPGKGLGFSGAARVAGLVAAIAEQGGTLDSPDALSDVLVDAADLDGHPDNVAASLYGGVVAVAGATAVRVPLRVDGMVVVWIPPTDTSTKQSSGRLPAQVPLADAVFNIGRTALLVAAIAAGDLPALRAACEDRLHQDLRLEEVPESRRALEAALAAGAWSAWLSGSGPSIAAWCGPGRASAVARALPGSGLCRVLPVARRGVRVEA
jgi:homoserine kinase